MSISHAEMVTGLAKPGKDIKAEMTQQNYSVLAAAIENFIQAGQELDRAKKQVIYQKSLGLSPFIVRPIPELPPKVWHLLHMAVGTAGEACELLEAVYSNGINGPGFDQDNMIEELGDIEFYNEGVRQVINVTQEETKEANIAKLGVRYEGFDYTDEAAQERADKAA